MFKDSQGRWITNGLFKETAATTQAYVIMTLAEAKEKYIACADPTGYDFSNKYVGGFQHWKALKNSAVLESIISEWEEELEVAIRCQALKNIDQLSMDGQFQASKFLMDRGWEKRKAGKPSKEAVAKETRVQSKMKEDWKSDIARIDR